MGAGGGERSQYCTVPVEGGGGGGPGVGGGGRGHKDWGAPVHYAHGVLGNWSRFYESAQQRYANLPTETLLARNFETVKFPITSSPRARPSNSVNDDL